MTNLTNWESSEFYKLNVKIETENQNRKNSFPKLRFNKIEYLDAL